MAWNFRPGIRTEIVFTLTVLMIGAVALIGILFLKVEERNLLQQKVKGGKQMMASLQRFLEDLNPADFILAADRASSENLQRIIALSAPSHLFANFSVVDRQFRVLADSRPERVGTILRDDDLEKAFNTGKILAYGAGEGESFSLMKKSPLFLSAPLVHRGETWGALHGEISLDDLRETLSRSQAQIFLYILFDAFLLIAVGSFLLSRVIVKPLKKLVQMSEKIAKGNLDSMSEPSGGDEVGKLFSSFNRMASRLREDRAKVEDYIRSLERVNRELRQAQNEVIRSEKLASIGRLAAGVAHEVGNPTGALLGYLNLLTSGGLTPEEEKEILNRAGNEAERIRRIIRELLDFSRPAPGLEEQVDINGVIGNALSLLSHQKKIWEQIQVVKELQEDLPPWLGDPHQLQQVMINLFLNAIDALTSSPLQGTTGEKKLRVSTRALTKEEAADCFENLSRRRKEDSPAVDYSLLRARERPFALSQNEVFSVVQIEVEDTGPGITPEALGKIFDPFYSTKPPGEGTGLGLAICLRIIEAYSGRILVKSEEGKGTTFTILLPILDSLHRGERKDR
ncbi:MAG: HAMP domain-containing protein [Deltaproteobacteria bacterium]|nr:HAMP domain-containing protein [Deltaproteobacteria bacterium]